MSNLQLSDKFPLYVVLWRFPGKDKIHTGTARRDPSNGMWFAADSPGGAEIIKDLGLVDGGVK